MAPKLPKRMVDSLPRPPQVPTSAAHTPTGRPQAAGSRPSCPVQIDADQIAETAAQLTKAIRKLKRDLKACEQCTRVDDCPIIEQVRSRIHQAISEVSEEMGII